MQAQSDLHISNRNSDTFRQNAEGCLATASQFDINSAQRHYLAGSDRERKGIVDHQLRTATRLSRCEVRATANDLLNVYSLVALACQDYPLFEEKAEAN